MAELIQQTINGLSLGSIYALIALGYTMVYGIIGLINFAHGDIYMVGAYVGFLSVTYLHTNLFITIIIAMLISAVLGVLIERIAYKPLRNTNRITALITAIGVSLLLEYGMMYIFGPDTRSFPKLIDNQIFHIGDVIITSNQIFIFITTIVLMILLQFIVQKTKTGRAMRAVSVSSDAAKLCGINVDKTISITFAIGSALAGAAGVLVGVYYNSINPLMGMTMGLKAFIAAVFGGIGLIPGAMLGGEFIGIAETFVVGFLPVPSSFKDLVVYIILIIVLIFKPSGILGKDVKEKV